MGYLAFQSPHEITIQKLDKILVQCPPNVFPLISSQRFSDECLLHFERDPDLRIPTQKGIARREKYLPW
jgi:hypothetical protein